MENTRAKIVASHVVQRQSGVLKGHAICVNGFPIRVHDDDGLRNDIDNLYQFSLGFLDFLKRERQRGFGSSAFDGNSGNPASITYELYLGRLWVSNFAFVHSERV